MPIDPPPLPSPSAPAPADTRKRSGCRTALIVIASLAGSFLLFVGAILIFQFSAREITLTESQKPASSQWKALLIGLILTSNPPLNLGSVNVFSIQSIEVFYFYDDSVDEMIQLDCTLTIERKVSDARTSYFMEWQALKVGNSLADFPITIEEIKGVFDWGDDSKLVYQISEGERQGFAFIGRKGKKIFFLDCWGLVLDDPKDIGVLLKPYLERFEKEKF